jgi:predicted nuclease with TOPRIM domain
LIYIYKNEAQEGPFQAVQIEEGLRNGIFSVEDFAWTEGLSEWVPLRDILQPVLEQHDAQVSETHNIQQEQSDSQSNFSAEQELNAKLEEYYSQIREYIPGWKPNPPQRINDLKAYFHNIKHAVENYLSFSIEELKSEIFYDMGSGREYMLFFPTLPSESQLHNFKVLMLTAYFKKKCSEEFNHLLILKKAFPGVEAERFD